jgi:glutathionylspermidine synthase
MEMTKETGVHQLSSTSIRRGSTRSALYVPSVVDESAFAEIRRSLLLHCCKWDPQVGDVSTLANFPLVLRHDVWEQLATWAEQLAAESAAAEAELFGRPELFRKLGLPRSLRLLLRPQARQKHSPGIARVMRFDFHPTLSGWQISEANSDVPGGFTEASSFTSMMAAHFPHARPTGDPADLWARAMAKRLPDGGVVALLVAPGYMEDQQVVAYLAGRLRERGMAAHVCAPQQLQWREGKASLSTTWCSNSVDAMVRFYQAEWLARLPRRYGASHLFRGGLTAISNPGSASLIESKRFPLVWDELETPLPTWRKLLPETRDPRRAPWFKDDDWILKAAFCNTGDEVAIRDCMPQREWCKAARSARWNPAGWIAQRRFETQVLDTPIGPIRPCIGVYTIDGKASGIYGRLSRGPVVDYAATDVAVLVESLPEGSFA